jgi:Bacteriophage abortive infection AbiH
MNKLIIIGNGFDLAHGLPTRYSDFIEWEINQLFDFEDKSKNKLMRIVINEIVNEYFLDELYAKYGRRLQLTTSDDKDISSYEAARGQLCDHGSRITFKFKGGFFNHIFNKCKTNNWVDIETLYYEELIKLENVDSVKKLNDEMSMIGERLKEYLNTLDYISKYNEGFAGLFNAFLEPEEYEETFQDLINTDDIELAKIQSNVHILNFNYTPTIENYLKQGMQKLSIDGVDQESMKFSEAYPYFVQLNYIHGVISDDHNSIVFGYGDETDKHYKELEDKNENCWLDHMKSFSYLKTSNYKYLFDFLSEGDFEVHVMGHSLGISDRLLFNHIFEHDKFDKVQLHYYEWKNVETERMENDFYKRTQELSRHFKDDAKHKMRLKVVPFNKSQPLPH